MNNTTYSAKIDQLISSIHMAGIATKILQHMDRVRNVSDLSQARRWGMELLQNARDVSYEDQPVKIRICLEEDKLSFSHNGRPFRVKDILSIINQVSSKSDDAEKVGKFGTGFVTTFQLSEKVEISSILQDGDLPHKPFHIVLDRSGQSNEEILNAIGSAMEELKQVDLETEYAAFVKDNYNTRFLYHLETLESKNAARVGMEDLEHNIHYILLFSEKIQEICLEFVLPDRQEMIRYSRIGNRKIEGNLLSRMDFEMCRQRLDGEVERRVNHSVLYLTHKDVTLAAGWKEQEGFVKFSEFTPRLFVDFPLIGAEQFPFPVVIGCRNFKTNEPRSGITLVDNASSRDALVNKEIMGWAVDCYESFLREAIAVENKGLENILAIPQWKENREMSEQWVKKHIYKALYHKISTLLSFHTKDGKGIQLNHPYCYLIGEEKKEYREEIRALLESFENVYVPYDDTDWYGVLEHYPMQEEKIWSLDKILEKAEQYAKLLKGKNRDALSWLQNLYSLGLKKEECAVKIRTGQIRILPNQNYETEENLYTVNELKIDPKIPEILKDVCEKLDVLEGSNALDSPLNIRNELLHFDFHSEHIPEIGVYEKAKVESYIISRSNRNFPVRNFSLRKDAFEKAWEEAWMLLLSCGPDEELYQLLKVKLGERLQKYHRCDGEWTNNLWYPAYRGLLNQITERMKGCKTLARILELDMSRSIFYTYDVLDEILWELNGGEEKEVSKLLEECVEAELIQWLNGIIAKGFEYLPAQEVRYKAIFPNQKGRLKAEQWLKKDETPDDVLKEIARSFVEESSECDFYENTLDRRIKIENLVTSGLTEEMVAFRINQILQTILSTKTLGDTPIEYQMACTRLLEWMDLHHDLASSYFPAFADEKDKVRLMTPLAVVGLQRKAKEIDKALKEMGANSLEELQKKFAEYERKLKGLEQEDVCWYYGISDVYFDKELLAYGEAEREEKLREIGNGGERHAYQCVTNHFLNQGYDKLEEKEKKIILKNQENQYASIQYGDGGAYHQAGWDILVKCWKDQLKKTGENGCVTEIDSKKEEHYYIEVKTHTPNSNMRNQFRVSREQMKLAALQQEHYVLMQVVYDYKQSRGVKCDAFVNPVKCLGEGKLKGEATYNFWF